MSAVDLALGFLIICLIVDRVILEGRLAWRDLGLDRERMKEVDDE